MPVISNMVIFFGNVFWLCCNYDIVEYILADFGGNFPKTKPGYGSQAKIPKFYLNFKNYLQ